MQFPLQGIQWRLDLVTPQRAVRAELPEGVPVSWRPENPRDFSIRVRSVNQWELHHIFIHKNTYVGFFCKVRNRIFPCHLDTKWCDPTLWPYILGKTATFSPLKPGKLVTLTATHWDASGAGVLFQLRKTVVLGVPVVTYWKAPCKQNSLRILPGGFLRWSGWFASSCSWRTSNSCLEHS